MDPFLAHGSRIKDSLCCLWPFFFLAFILLKGFIFNNLFLWAGLTLHSVSAGLFCGVTVKAFFKLDDFHGAKPNMNPKEDKIDTSSVSCHVRDPMRAVVDAPGTKIAKQSIHYFQPRAHNCQWCVEIRSTPKRQRFSMFVLYIPLERLVSEKNHAWVDICFFSSCSRGHYLS